MSRVHALGKVDEPLEKSTLVNDRGNWAWWGEKGKNFQPNRKRRGRNFTAASFMLYCCLFYSGTEGTVEWRKWRFPVLLLFLSPTTTKVNGVVFGFFFPSFLSGVGISSHFMILPVPPFLSHNPLMGCFAFFSFALFLRGRGWPGHTSTAGQPISSPTFISLSCLMLKNFHTGELCQIV